MKINPNDSHYHINQNIVNTPKSTDVQRINNDKSTSPVQPPESEDVVVSISQKSKEIQIAKEVIQSEPEIRTNKVQEIKERIADGRYNINYESISEKIIKEFL